MFVKSLIAVVSVLRAPHIERLVHTRRDHFSLNDVKHSLTCLEYHMVSKVARWNKLPVEETFH